MHLVHQLVTDLVEEEIHGALCASATYEVCALIHHLQRGYDLWRDCGDVGGGLVAVWVVVLCLGELTRSGCQRDWLRKQLRRTPLERLVVVFQQQHQADGLRRILESYSHFLTCYSDPAFRVNLETDVDTSETTPSAHPLYRQLRGNAEGLQDELVGFMLGQQGVWSDAFFRYLVL